MDPAINQVGQIATALSSSANAQQNSGLDLTGKQGANIFSVGAPQAIASSKNTGSASATVSVTNVGALTTNDYVLSYKGGAYSLTNASTGAAVPFTGTGTAGDPLTADGISVVLSGTPANGDSFLIQPTATAAGSFTATLSSPSQIAAAAALQVSPAAANTGSGKLSDVLNPNGASPAGNHDHQFHQRDDVPGQRRGAGADGGQRRRGQFRWLASDVERQPREWRRIHLQSDPSATGDNTNALASAAQQTQGVLSGGTTSINAATSALITATGSQASQVNTAQDGPGGRELAGARECAVGFRRESG